MTVIRRQETNQSVELAVGSKLSKVSSMLDTSMPCRHAQCGTCIFRILHGEEALKEATRREQRTLERVDAPDDGRLLCQTRIADEGTVEVAKYERPAAADGQEPAKRPPQTDSFAGARLPTRAENTYR